MRVNEEQRLKNYLGVLNYVYYRKRINVNVCKEYSVTKSFAMVLKKMGIIEINKGKAEWIADEQPSDNLAIKVMDFVTKKNLSYKNAKKELPITIDFSSKDKAAEQNESSKIEYAIKLLKKHGYRIMQPITEYKEV
jgi:hypothetical protein